MSECDTGADGRVELTLGDKEKRRLNNDSWVLGRGTGWLLASLLDFGIQGK